MESRAAYILQGVLHPSLSSIIWWVKACLSLKVCRVFFPFLGSHSLPSIPYFHASFCISPSLLLSLTTSLSVTFHWPFLVVSALTVHPLLLHLLESGPRLNDYIRFLLEYARHKITLGHYASTDCDCAGRKWRIAAQRLGVHYSLHWHRPLGSLRAQREMAHCAVNTDIATGDADVSFLSSMQEAQSDEQLNTACIKNCNVTTVFLDVRKLLFFQ